jgi:hypothetical protein
MTSLPVDSANLLVSRQFLSTVCSPYVQVRLGDGPVFAYRGRVPDSIRVHGPVDAP